MRAKLPATERFANKLFAAGIGTYWRAGGLETAYAEVVDSYLSTVSIPKKLEIVLRAFYHRLKP